LAFFHSNAPSGGYNFKHYTQNAQRKHRKRRSGAFFKKSSPWRHNLCKNAPDFRKFSLTSGLSCVIMRNIINIALKERSTRSVRLRRESPIGWKGFRQGKAPEGRSRAVGREGFLSKRRTDLAPLQARGIGRFICPSK
jgi:hypothetical protein